MSGVSAVCVFITCEAFFPIAFFFIFTCHFTINAKAGVNAIALPVLLYTPAEEVLIIIIISVL